MNRTDLAKVLREIGKDIKVLYAEDDSQARESTSEILSYYFKYITTAENGKVGLEKHKNDKFDLVISDINMPVMNGIEMCKKIKKIDDMQPILIISAHSDLEYLLELIEIGVDGFLLKPMDSDSFRKTLYKIVNTINDKIILKRYEEILLDTNEKLEQKNRELQKTISKLTKEENKNLVLIDAVKNETQIQESVLDFISPNKKILSAEEFAEVSPIDLTNKEDRLKKILEGMEIGINTISNDTKSLQRVIEELLELSVIVYSIGEFNNIANAFESLAINLGAVENIEEQQILKRYLYALLDNINHWLDAVFANKDAIDIHYMDASFVADILSIESMFEKDSSDEEIILF